MKVSLAPFRRRSFLCLYYESPTPSEIPQGLLLYLSVDDPVASTHALLPSSATPSVGVFNAAGVAVHAADKCVACSNDATHWAHTLVVTHHLCISKCGPCT
ncbi:hypothetical protein BHM03_00006870 [Ensete ventricosum]|nr:hypothetical protein BHM03_00006870 [Ensete ventricosum]